MQLSEFQNRFKDLMLDHPDALDAPPEDLAGFCETGEIDLPTRLKVYRNNIVGSLTGVMIAIFPIMEKLVGREFMELMARSFILENPPSGGCLNSYGDGFAEFIEGFELAKSLPYLADVARYELAINQSYYGADDAPLKTDALSEIAPEKLGDLPLRLRNSIKLVQSRFPLISIQEFCNADDPDGTLSLDQGGVFLMIMRPELETQTVELSAAEFEMLSHLAQGKTLGDALEATLNTHQEFDVQEFLQKHLSLATFQAF